MKLVRTIFISILFALLLGGVSLPAQDVPKDYQEVLALLGRSGDYKANVLKVNVPRSDLHVTISDVATPTTFGFGGWVALTKGDEGNDVMMGDLVLLQEEVNPVMSALLDNGLEVTALHNHFFWEEPRIFFMHVHGHGKALDLAKRVKPALDLIPRPSTPAPAAAPAAPAFNLVALDNIVGGKGEVLGSVYKFTLGRDDLNLKEHGAAITEGVEYVPDQRKVYTSNSGDNTIGVIDIAQRKVIKKLKTEAKPDGSTYAAPFHKLYVSDERGKAEAIVDVRTDTIINTLHFDSETGMPQYDPVSKLVYVNLQDTERFAVMDPQDDRVLAQYPVAGCRGNHGMALAPEQRRAFLVCEGNNLLAIFDLEKHAVVQTLPLPEGGDVVKADPGRGRVFVACYSGAIAAVQVLSSGQYKKIADAPVEKRVHSLAIDPETGDLYVPEEQEKGAPASRLIVYSLPGEVH